MYILVFVYFFMLHVHQRTVQTAEVPREIYSRISETFSLYNAV